MPVINSVNQLRDTLNSKLDEAGQYWLQKIPASLGNYARVVKVPNTQSMVYARLSNGQVVEVFNNVAPNIFDWQVFVGRDKSQPNLLKVLEVRWIYNAAITVAYILFHHQQHEFPAPDTVWVHRDQFLPLLVLPGGGFHVRLYGDVIYTTGMANPIRIENIDDIDLSAYIVTLGAKYVLMEVTPPDGTLNYVEGDLYDTLEILRAEAPFPAPTEGAFPVCVIEFYEGQTEIRRDSTMRNIVDLRMFTSNVNVSTGPQINTASVDTPADSDEWGFWDVVDNALKKITQANLRMTWFSDGEGDPSNISHTAPSDGTSAYAARRDHVHFESKAGLQIVMDPVLTDPPVPVLTPDGDDYVYYEA